MHTVLRLVVAVCTALSLTAQETTRQKVLRLRAQAMAAPVFKDADWKSDFAAALAAAKKERKFVFAYFAWLDGELRSPSERLEQGVLSSKPFRELGKHVVLFVQFDSIELADTDPDLSHIEGSSGRPAFYLLDQDGRCLKRVCEYGGDLTIEAVRQDMERLQARQRIYGDLAGGARLDAATKKRLLMLEVELAILPWRKLLEMRSQVELPAAEAAVIDQELINLQSKQLERSPDAEALRELLQMARDRRIPKSQDSPEIGFWSTLIRGMFGVGDIAHMREAMDLLRSQDYPRDGWWQHNVPDWEAQLALLELEKSMASGRRTDDEAQRDLFRLELRVRRKSFADLAAMRASLDFPVGEARRLDQLLVNVEADELSSRIVDDTVPSALVAMWNLSRIPDNQNCFRYFQILGERARSAVDVVMIEGLRANMRRIAIASDRGVPLMNFDDALASLSRDAENLREAWFHEAEEQGDARLFDERLQTLRRIHGSDAEWVETMLPPLEKRLATLKRKGKAKPSARAAAADSKDKDKFADTDAKRALLAKATASIGSNPNWDYFTTRRLIVLWERNSTKPREAAAERKEKQQDAEFLERRFDACERFLPPHPQMQSVFCIVRIPKQNVALQGRSTDSQLQLARDGELEYPPRDYMYWAAYEKAWFGVEIPGSWFSQLGIAIVDCEITNATRPGEKRRLDTRTKMELKALKKADCLGFLAQLPAGDARPFTSTEGSDSPTNVAWAAFLEFGPQQERKWDPRWASWLVTYAEAVRGGATDTQARQTALAGIDVTEFEEALARWAPRAK